MTAFCPTIVRSPQALRDVLMSVGGTLRPKCRRVSASAWKAISLVWYGGAQPVDCFEASLLGSSVRRVHGVRQVRRVRRSTELTFSGDRRAGASVGIVTLPGSKVRDLFGISFGHGGACRWGIQALRLTRRGRRCGRCSPRDAPLQPHASLSHRRPGLVGAILTSERSPPR